MKIIYLTFLAGVAMVAPLKAIDSDGTIRLYLLDHGYNHLEDDFVSKVTQYMESNRIEHIAQVDLYALPFALAKTAPPESAPTAGSVSLKELMEMIKRDPSNNKQIHEWATEGAALGRQINALSKQGVDACKDGDSEGARSILKMTRPLIDRFNVIVHKLGVTEWIKEGDEMLSAWQEAAADLRLGTQ